MADFHIHDVTIRVRVAVPADSVGAPAVVPARFLARPRVADWIIKRAQQTPYSDIVTDGDVYMRRWWLFNPYPGTYQGGTYLRRYPWCPISIRVHQILRPDRERDLHDHPWNARTFILRGSYAEVREGSDRWEIRLPGDTAPLRFGEFHRIVSVIDSHVPFTLFVTGKYQGTWGFKVDGKKVPYREHLGLPPKEHAE